MRLRIKQSYCSVLFRRSFGPPKCCHPQISDLGFIISWWQLSCEIFLQILTSLELHSNSANRPGILLSHDGSLEVNLLMIFLELSLKKTSRMTKSDICGWQHLRVPKYLLDVEMVHFVVPIMIGWCKKQRGSKWLIEVGLALAYHEPSQSPTKSIWQWKVLVLAMQILKKIAFKYRPRRRLVDECISEF